MDRREGMRSLENSREQVPEVSGTVEICKDNLKEGRSKTEKSHEVIVGRGCDGLVLQEVEIGDGP